MDNVVTPVNSNIAKYWPEVGRLPNWNDESSLSAGKLLVPDNFVRQMNLGTEVVVMVRPIMGESIYATRAGLIKSGIEALNSRRRCTGKQTYHRYGDPTSRPER